MDSFEKFLFILLFYSPIVCKSQRIFYFLTDLTDTDWNTFKINTTTDESLIPNNFIAWALYSNTINETGFVLKVSTILLSDN